MRTVCHILDSTTAVPCHPNRRGVVSHDFHSRPCRWSQQDGLVLLQQSLIVSLRGTRVLLRLLQVFGPEKIQYRTSCGLIFRPIGPKIARKAFCGCQGTLEAEKMQPGRQGSRMYGGVLRGALLERGLSLCDLPVDRFPFPVGYPLSVTDLLVAEWRISYAGRVETSLVTEGCRASRRLLRLRWRR